MIPPSFNGWLILDKPLGLTSAATLRPIQKLVKPHKVGHAGTLDPLATGILPIGIGEATKIMPYIIIAHKEYVFTITWGEKRTTGDAEGEIMETSPERPNLLDIQQALPPFKGTILQVPPAFSAIKIQGKRAYSLARDGETVVLEPRPVEIYDLQVRNHTPDTATFWVHCGKGTYVRSLAEDIAASLGTVGYVSALRRIAVGPFREKDSIPLDKVLEQSTQTGLQRYLLSLDHGLDDILAITVNDAAAVDLRHGKAIEFTQAVIKNGSIIRVKNQNGILFAFCEYESGILKPKRILNVF